MKTLRLVIVIFYLVIILLNFLQNTYAAQADAYPVPDVIRQTELLESDDADTILTSAKLQSILVAFSRSLKPEEIDKQSMFNKIALLSLRGDAEAIELNIKQHGNTLNYLHYQFYHQTLLALASHSETNTPFVDQATRIIQSKISEVDDKAFVQLVMALGWSVSNAKTYVFNVYKQVQQQTSLSQSDMVNVAVNTHLYHVLNAIIPIANRVISTQQTQRFIIQPNQLVNLSDNVSISATIVTSRRQPIPSSTALQYTIYADEAAHIKTAMNAAAHGYIGIVANSRGKRSSTNAIVPWEHEGEDAAQLINWITKQDWSNGNVVMYGGSYNGFTQWATAKHMPKGLKAIAPYVAANLITGLPYENNIALTGNFEWPLYVTNNNTVDDTVYSDWQRTNEVVNTLYTSGRPIVDLDKLASHPSPWLQKWLDHPDNDSYYQNMVPHQQEYSRINIPVLSITGYFEGGQISALDYLKQHYQYNANANHALLIGPYNHWSAQNTPRSHHSNYALDPVALEKDTEAVVFSWFDHVLYGKPKPDLVQNKVNYQLMGANKWRFAESLETLNNQTQPFYIQNAIPSNQTHYLLTTSPSSEPTQYIEQIVDLADRTEQRNQAPWPVIQDKLDTQGGIYVATPEFERDMELTGSITGFFDIAINKKDVDIGFNYYEVTSEGEVFHLNNYRSRASYADDNSKRRLLVPNEIRRVPIVNARFTSKLIKKGSRLVLVLNVNKNVDAQVNLGTGTAVNHEHISQAGEPLRIRWYLSSQINLPLKEYVSRSDI